MVSSEFNKRKEIISNYFRHPRWIYHGENDWDFEYYKGKRNMQELEAALKIVFGDEYTNYDLSDVEAINVIKFDILGLKTMDGEKPYMSKRKASKKRFCECGSE